MAPTVNYPAEKGYARVYSSVVGGAYPEAASSPLGALWCGSGLGTHPDENSDPLWVLPMSAAKTTETGWTQQCKVRFFARTFIMEY